MVRQKRVLGGDKFISVVSQADLSRDTQGLLKEDLLAGLNTIRRDTPAILEGASLEGNAGLVVSSLRAHGPKSGLSVGEESEFRSMLNGIYGHERLVHRFYNDGDGSKLMSFLFGERDVALLSMGMLGLSGRPQKAGMKADFRVDRVLGAGDFVFCSRELGDFHESGADQGTVVVLKPEAFRIKNLVGFNNVDSYYVGGFVEQLEIASLGSSPLGPNLSIVEAVKRGLYETTSNPNELEAAGYGGFGGNIPQYMAHVYFRDDVWRKILGGLMFPRRDLDSVRTEYSLVSRGLEGKEVEARVMAGVVGDVVGQPLDIAWHRWREHIDDVLMPSHLLFNGATEPKEFLVPRGVGSRFIEKVVVSDGDYQKIEDKVHAEYKGRFAVGGRDWRDVVVKAEEYNNSQRIVEGRQLIGEFRERFGVK